MTKKAVQPYVPKHHYSWSEQVEFYRQDLLSDAEHSEHQAANGPCFPNVTKESLLAYAAECREQAKDPEPHLIKALGYKRCPEIEKLFTCIRE